MKTRSQSKMLRGWQSTLTLLVGLIVLPIAMLGCQSGDSNTSATGLTSAVDTELALEPLTIGDVMAKVALKSDQETVMKSILDQYNRLTETNHAARLEERTNGERGFRRGSTGERPLHALLIESAKILESDQMVELLGLVKERQGDRRSQRQARFTGNEERGQCGNGERRFGGQRGEVFDDLNLSDVQQSALDELREEFRDQMMTLDNGERGFGRSDEAKTLREQHREQLEAILTPSQLQQLEENRGAQRTERQGRMQEGAAERQEERIELLSSVLSLSDAQASQVEVILASAHDKMQQLHETMKGGDTDRDAIHEQMDQIHTETHDAIGGLLSTDQQTIYKALTDLRPSGHRGRRGPR